MIRFIIRRLASGLMVLFLFQTAVFFLVQLILPGDFVSHLALGLTNEGSAQLRRQLGLDLPIWQRYLQWIANLLKGDLGYSYSFAGRGRSVMAELGEALPPSILVFGLGTIIAFLLGQWLGRISAWRGSGLLSKSITFSSITLYTSFPPWLAFLVIYFVASRFRLLRPGFNHLLWNDAAVTQSEVMRSMAAALSLGFLALLVLNLAYKRRVRRSLPAMAWFLLLIPAWVASWQFMGIFPFAVDVARAAALPLFTYVLLSFGEIMLLMRTTMLDVKHEQYVFTARAKGLPDAFVRDRHAAPNAILPVLSGLVIRLPYFLTGSVMIERSLDWEGMGTSLFFAVGLQDILLVMGLVLVFGVISLAARLILDILYAVLDPRIRFDSNLSQDYR